MGLHAMDGSNSCLVIKSSGTSFATMAHHRELPELSGNGSTPLNAVRGLLQRLIAEREHYPDTLHRDRLERIITDVKTTLDVA